MTKYFLHIPIVFLLLLHTSCETKTYQDHYAPLRTDNIRKITFEIQSSDTMKHFTIKDKHEMQEFIERINNSKVNGPWKGANWDKIILKYDDGETTFNTNGEVFGQNSSGTFYDLNDRYKTYWNK